MYLIISIIFIIIAIILGLYHYNTKPIIIKKCDSKFNKTTIQKNKAQPELYNLTEYYSYLYDRNDLNYIRPINTRKGKAKANIIEQPTPTRPSIFIPTETQIEEYNLKDKQTVHDTYVQKETKKKYNEIKKAKHTEEIQSDSDEQLDNSITLFINQKKYCNEAQTVKILNIIDKIRKRNNTLTNFSDTEYNILKNTWYNNEDSNIREEILNQLKDCVDITGNLYCPTGTTTRIIESVYINNPEKYPKTKHTINQEMLNTASKIRELYSDDTEFKEHLMKHYYKEYQGILSHKEIDNTVKDWIDFI